MSILNEYVKIDCTKEYAKSGHNEHVKIDLTKWICKKKIIITNIY